MSGLLFIISIPTENYELNLDTKPKKLFDRPLTPQSDTEHGTTTQFLTPTQSDINPKNSGYNSSTLSARQTPISTKTFSTSLKKQMFQRAMSFDKGLNSVSIDREANLPPNGSGLQSTRTCQTEPPTKKRSGKETLSISEDSSMEFIMFEILKKIKIENAIWQLSRDQHHYQITFIIDDLRRDHLWNSLNEWGIGDRKGSSVSMIPCSLYNGPIDENTADDSNKDHDASNLTQKQTVWNRFLHSMRAHLNVAQIVYTVKQDATITFDFIIMLIVAGILAALGLLESNLVSLVSSMLISPLMGPIIATIFGVVIKDMRLIRLGLVNELIGLLLATLVGLVFGLIYCTLDSSFAFGSFEGITTEMKERGDLRSLAVGLLIAIVSGAAVAIAIIGENTGSLVGVAISASILPPAVNAGILWALSIIYIYYEKDDTRYCDIIKPEIYSDHQGTELAIHGCVSMLLTIINVLSIWVMGILVLKIKEVAPIVSKHQRQFWRHDIKVARDYNKTCQSNDDLQLLAHEIADFQCVETEIDPELLRNIDRTAYQNTWSPATNRTGIFHRDNEISISDLGKLYIQMTNDNRKSHGYSNHAKTFVGKYSPPKYHSLNEHIFTAPGAQRRASVPFVQPIESGGIPSMGLNAYVHSHNGFKNAQLEQINEIQHSDRESSNIDIVNAPTVDNQESTKNKKKYRKFIVTPASDR